MGADGTIIVYLKSVIDNIDLENNDEKNELSINDIFNHVSILSLLGRKYYVVYYDTDKDLRVDDKNVEHTIRAELYHICAEDTITIWT